MRWLVLLILMCSACDETKSVSGTAAPSSNVPVVQANDPPMPSPVDFGDPTDVAHPVDGGQADGGQADGGQADGGQADGGQADGGQRVDAATEMDAQNVDGATASDDAELDSRNDGSMEHDSGAVDGAT